ncbi:hypothetical protein QR98_0037160 [Sarcoptes scabiei]|uniref:Uncharacterized protein n=1 Tax=Sarcoptes scabiei TaxID=52283 RepID=A0A132A3S3_SARSC|nr:hypothetical protein QR98_0037160 [Sarcoptes scabiei]
MLQGDSWRCLLADTSQSGSMGSGGSGSSPPLGAGTFESGMITESQANTRRFKTLYQTKGNKGSYQLGQAYPSIANPSAASALHDNLRHNYYNRFQSGSVYPKQIRNSNLEHPSLSVSSLPSVVSDFVGSRNELSASRAIDFSNSKNLICPSARFLRAEFRKSSSQPSTVQRSKSPPILTKHPWIPSETNFDNQYNFQGAKKFSGQYKKRHLPLVPTITNAFNFGGSVRSLNNYRQNFNPDMKGTIETMYSDSEITLRPVFGSRPLLNQSILSIDNQNANDTSRQQRNASLENIDGNRNLPAISNLYSQEIHSESDLSSSGYHTKQIATGSSSNLNYRIKPKDFTSSSIDYRELKEFHNAENYGDADGEEETEIDDENPNQHDNRAKYYHRKELSNTGDRRDSQNKNHNLTIAGHHRASVHRRSSRRKKEKQMQHKQPAGDESEIETESSLTPREKIQPRTGVKQDHLHQSLGLNDQSLLSDVIPTARPKGSRTLSEFTGHRGHQHSAPVHPPHPSRSSLAVARSLSERCKEDKLIEGSFSDVPITSDVKSYSDQIDAVMEQLNANCDFSLDLLLADPASNVANKTSDGKGKKKHDPYGLPVQPGLTKKSNSASQLSLSNSTKPIYGLNLWFVSMCILEAPKHLKVCA